MTPVDADEHDKKQLQGADKETAMRRAVRWLAPGSTLVVFAMLLFSCTEDAPSRDGWTAPSNDAIHALLTQRMSDNGVGIVAGVVDANGSRVVAYGHSGAADGRPLNGDSVFLIGSVTKSITGLLLAEMAVRGEVSLNDAAANYLPTGVAMPEQGRPITLLDLSTHRSGLPSMPANFDLEGRPDPYAAYTVEQLHDFLSTFTPGHAPGEAARYSNLGVALLGRLLANHAGTDYEDLVTTRILAPLEMSSTSITLNADQLSRLSPGHDRYLQPVRTWEMTTLQASGSLRSTANDMLKLLSVYLGYVDTELQSAISLQLTDQLPGTEDFQGLGLGLTDEGSYAHSGGKQGYRSGMAFNPRTGIGAVVLANARTDDRPIDLARYLVSGRALEPAPPAPRGKPRIRLSEAALDRYAGDYVADDGAVYAVARNGSNLVMRYPSNAILEFMPTDTAEFFYNGGNDDIVFEVNDAGQATAVTLYGDGRRAGGGQVLTRIDD